MKWVSSKDLSNWAPKRDCQETLPLLIRKLIRASTSEIKMIRFPSDDNIHLPGWDGILECSEGSEFFPTEISLWEIGTNADFKTKANKEYAKRTKEPVGYDTLLDTFIFVTPYTWNQKDRWIKKKKEDGKWKDIRVIDGETLEEWLEITPTVSSWLASIHLKISPSENVQSLEDFWDEWAFSPDLTLSKDILLGGRENQVSSLIKRIQESPQIIPIQSSSREESLAFIVASFKSDLKLEEDLFARSIIVDTPESFRKLVTLKKSLILISRFEDNIVVNKAVREGFRVLVPLGADASKNWTEVIALQRLDREKFVQTLVTSGISRDLAEKYSIESTRNITILRRQLKFDRNKPLWAKGENIRDIIPSFLAGKWDENSIHDKELVAQLAKEPYDRYIERLSKWLITQDSPIIKIGSQWRLASPMDAWIHCASFMTTQDLELFERCAHSVLSEIDPIFSIDPKERHFPSGSQKSKLYSNKLRKGIGQSLVLIAVFGDSLKINIPGKSQNFVDSFIQKLLNNSNPLFWRSLDDIFPLLGEASPDVFLDIVDRLSLIKDSPIIALFIEEEGYFNTYSYYTGLLWALERIAWLKSTLTKATILLGRLAENDPGGHLSNRPINSLTEIFKSWHPQTLTDNKGRIDALKKLLQVHPGVCLKLLFRLLPQGQGVAFPTNHFRWRLFDESFERPLTYPEIWQFHTEIIDLILQNIPESEEEYSSLAHFLQDLRPTDREKVLNYFWTNYKRIPKSKHLVWNELRKILGRHRTVPNAYWALPKGELDKIEKIYLKFTPKNLIDQTLWLFNEYPQFAEGYPEKTPFQEQEEKVKSIRISGLKKIYDRFGLKKILESVNLISESQAFGQALGYVITSEKNILRLLELIKINDNHRRIIIQSFLWQKSIISGLPFAFGLIHKAFKRKVSNEELASLFLSLVFNKQVWDELENYDIEVQTNYWKKCRVNFHWISGEELQFAIAKLLDAGRFPSIISEISLYIEKISSELILDVLEKTAKEKSDDPTRAQNYDFERLFEKLYGAEGIDVARLVQLEWNYLPVLSNYGDGIRPKYLDKELATNPVFFVDILKWIYKPDIEEAKSIDETENNHELQTFRARNAFELLYHWNTIPSVQPDGTIDFKILKKWTADVRQISLKCGRTKGANSEIGKLLSTFPESDPDYPPSSLCEIIEEINSDELNQGFYSGMYNKRGSSSRGVFDGGIREWKLVEYFSNLREKTASLYPITSNIFSKLSKCYENEAKWEDNQAFENDLEG